ncbi:MAG: iron ABC transporter permease [Eubacteriaceae bacterium]|nr:iron ABC transporter permease [Eubacteriaceae bacterium]
MDKRTPGKNNKYAYMLVSFAIMLAAGIVAAVCMGKYSVTPLESLRILLGLRDGSSEMTINVVMRLRIPRILASVMVGAALSVSGAVYQGVFRNPLVSPDYLGITSGASVGAAIGILLSLNTAFISLFAFAGGIAAMLLAMSLPVLLRNNSNIMLVMSGVIVGAAMSSVLGFIKYLADPESQLASIIYWTMGSFSYVSSRELLVIAPIVLLPMAVLFGMSWWIDVLSMGENDARALGANVSFVRSLALGCATLLTSASVCIAGTIGWIGLIIPHVGRLLAGPANRRLLPLAALAGGLFMLMADTITRTISVSEMPVGILTGALGVPFYCWLLYKQRETLL